MTPRPTSVASICDACLSRARPHRALHKPSSATKPALRSSYHTTATPYTTNASSSSQRIHRRQNAHPVPYTAKFSSLSLATQYSRAYSNTTSPRFQPSEAALIRLPSRRLISVSGADAQKFLQGLVTANVLSNDGQPYYCAFLDARGRVLWDVFVWPWPRKSTGGRGGGPETETESWGCYIEVDGAEVQALLKHLKRHKLRSRVQLALLPEATEEEVNEEAMSVWTAFNVIPAADDLTGLPTPWACHDPRFPPGTAVRFLHSGTTVPAPLGWMPPAETDEQQYALYRYVHGVPEGPTEIVRESALPMEYNIELANGIDFKKGCYVGQELTIRTKHQGVVRKRVLPVRLYRKGDPIPSSLIPEPAQESGSTVDFGFAAPATPAGDTQASFGFATNQPAIKAVDPESNTVKRGRPVGKMVARVGDAGIALCRLDVMVGMQSKEGGFDEGREFEIEQEEGALGGVRVKACLTEWLVRREGEVWGRGKDKGKSAGRGEDVE